jgi:hypothetical protein
MYVYCVYPAMSKKSEILSDLSKKDRNKCHSSPFINVVKGVFFVVSVDERNVVVNYIFGKTEISIMAEELKTGSKCNAKIKLI